MDLDNDQQQQEQQQQQQQQQQQFLLVDDNAMGNDQIHDQIVDAEFQNGNNSSLKMILSTIMIRMPLIYLCDMFYSNLNFFYTSFESLNIFDTISLFILKRLFVMAVTILFLLVFILSETLIKKIYKCAFLLLLPELNSYSLLKLKSLLEKLHLVTGEDTSGYFSYVYQLLTLRPGTVLGKDASVDDMFLHLFRFTVFYLIVNLLQIRFLEQQQPESEESSDEQQRLSVSQMANTAAKFVNIGALIFVYLNVNVIHMARNVNYIQLLVLFIANFLHIKQYVELIIVNFKFFLENYGVNNFVVFIWKRLKVPYTYRLYFVFKVVNFIAQYLLLRANSEKHDDLLSMLLRIPLNDQIDKSDYNSWAYFFLQLSLYLTNTIISVFSLTSVLSFCFYNIALMLRRYLYPQLNNTEQQRDDQQQQQNNHDADGDLLDIGEITAILFLILSVQSGITELQGPERLRKLVKNCLLLFIAILHFLHRILDQQLMQLSATTSYKMSASRNNDERMTLLKKRHFRTLLLSICLICIPIVMLSILWYNCKISTWLMAATCFNLELLIKMSVTLVIYSLFIVDSKRLKEFNEQQQPDNQPQQQHQLWANFDDYIYYIKSFGRVCELIFAIFLFFNSAFILVFESYGSIRAIMMCLHAYFHIYVQATKSWNEFMKRYTAVSKMKCLPVFQANKDNYEDVCAICYYDLKSAEARITACKHVYHSTCLRKWLYIQDTCPMCHSIVYSNQTAKQEASHSLTPTPPPQQGTVHH